MSSHVVKNIKPNVMRAIQCFKQAMTVKGDSEKGKGKEMGGVGRLARWFERGPKYVCILPAIYSVDGAFSP